MSEKQKSQEVIPKEITQLLEHRATLGKWLAKLEELSGTVRPEVHDRVRADYEERLRGQETELAAHRSEMEAALEERQTRVTVLEADRDERSAELEEAQLRFAVGEYKEGEFQKRKAEHEERLAALDAELKSDRDGLAELEEVVGVLGNLRAGAAGSGPRAAASESKPSQTGERAEPAWGTARGRSEEGAEVSVERTASAAEAAAVAVADARAAEAAEGAILESEEAVDTEPEEVPDAATAKAPEKTAEAEKKETEPAEAEESIVEGPAQAAAETDGEDYLDDLEFLESLSMDEIDRLDAVSAMLEDEPDTKGGDKQSGKSG